MDNIRMNPTANISLAPMLFRHIRYLFIISELFHKLPIVIRKLETKANQKSYLVFIVEYYWSHFGLSRNFVAGRQKGRQPDDFRTFLVTEGPDLPRPKILKENSRYESRVNRKGKGEGVDTLTGN
jgi:hypothetical protein